MIGNIAETMIPVGFDTLLGTMTDWEYSQETGVHVVFVFNRREELGIPAYVKGKCEDLGTTTPLRIYWTPEMDAKLGKAPDWWIDHILGLSSGKARARRVWLGAPSWMERYRILPKGVRRESKEGVRFFNARRRHHKAGLPDTLTLGQWEFAVWFFKGRCAYCGQKAALTEDHRVPLSKGGPRTALNILPCCWSCNSEKHTSKAQSWIRSRFSPDQAQVIEAKIVEYLTVVKAKEG